MDAGHQTQPKVDRNAPGTAPKNWVRPDAVTPAHRLKCWPQFFDTILAGEKRHDLRRCTDRAFEVGQVLELQEFDPQSERFTGRVQLVEVTYITSAELPCALSKGALHPDFCILSIRSV